MHNSIAINEIKPGFQSGNSQFGPKSMILCPLWPWNLTDDVQELLGHLFCTTISFVQTFKAISKFKQELQSTTFNSGKNRQSFCPVWPWNLMDALEKIRVPLLCYFKPCASFHRHQWNQTEVTVRKLPVRVKIDYFMSGVTFKFDG